MATSKGSGSSLRPNKRYITTHDANGKSIYAESPDQEFNLTEGFGGVARSFALEGVPAIFGNEADIKNYKGSESTASYRKRDIVVPGGGVHLVVVDIDPEGESPMHRTLSIDFSICVMGEIHHELDGGETVKLLPGDHIVQRGTMHKWINRSKTESARFVAVTIPAADYEIPGTGKMLAEEYLPKPKI